jgi:hypothetical protein
MNVDADLTRPRHLMLAARRLVPRRPFDPVRSADSAHIALGVADREVQTLYQLAHVAVSPAT